MVKVDVNSGKGFQFSETVLHETSRQKILAQVVKVPDEKGDIHHYDLVITKYAKNPSQNWSDVEPSKIRFTSGGTKSLQNLLDFLKSQRKIAQFSKATLEITDTGSISKDDREFVQNILTYFDTPEKRELLAKAKSEDINHLYASVKHAKNIKATDEFSVLLDDGKKELKLHSWVKDNTWVFGVEYIKFLDKSKIGIHSDSDFIVESLDGYADLIELKQSEFKLFNYDKDHDSYYQTSELSKAVGQSIKYLKVMEDSRLILKEEDGLNVLKPRIKIVIGRSSEMDDKEKEALRLLNDSLHNIEIMTYDEIKTRAERLNEHYSKL